MNKMIPHVYFKGNCLEAMNHYLHVFKGEVENLDKFKDQPIDVSEEHHNKIYFCHFKSDYGEFYASDSIDEMESRQDFWIHFDQLEELEQVALKLAKQEKLDFKQTVFGEHFVKFADPFGVHWTLITNL